MPRNIKPEAGKFRLIKQSKIRIGWIGFHKEGILALKAIAKQGFRVEAVITLDRKLASQQSGAADYRLLCKQLKLPIFEVEDINSSYSFKLLQKLNLDVVFVIGWTQLLHLEILSLAKIGMIGAHASLLPHNRGRAPINWALINGGKETGNTLFWLSEDVDSGDIIDQTIIPITPYDTCESLYFQVAKSNKEMIIRTIAKLSVGKFPRHPQRLLGEVPLPRRRPEDGLIDWTKDSVSIYNFVRALTNPYPGAFSWLFGHRWIIWKSALISGNCRFIAKPGEIIGPIISPVDKACGQIVACGKGILILLSLILGVDNFATHFYNMKMPQV